jgi:hypothetical protein
LDREEITMGNQYYYITKYPLGLCLEYMKHDNIYDIFSYKWEEEGNYYLITFIEYKNSILSLGTSPKPTFKVIFEDLENQTGINVKCLKNILQPIPFVYTKDIDMFWEKKLEAKRIGQKDG